jgi:hypothetical protein
LVDFDGAAFWERRAFRWASGDDRDVSVDDGLIGGALAGVRRTPTGHRKTAANASLRPVPFAFTPLAKDHRKCLQPRALVDPIADQKHVATAYRRLL